MLKHIDLFANLSPDDIVRINRICAEETCKAGQFIFRESDLSDDLYVVVEGEVEAGHDLDQQDRQDPLGRFTAGEIFGELSLFDGLPRSMDARALVDTRLLKISKDRWDQLIHAKRELGILILENVARMVCFRLRKTNWDLVLVKGGHHQNEG